MSSNTIPPANPEKQIVELTDKMTVNADKVILVSGNQEVLDHGRARVFLVLGAVFGSIFGPLATFFGLIFIACADGENNKLCWKRFTSFSMLGWILFSVLWFGGLYSIGVDVLSHVSKKDAGSGSTDTIPTVVIEAATPPVSQVDIDLPLTVPDANIVPVQDAAKPIPTASPLPIHPWVPPVKKVSPAATSASPIHKIYAHQYGFCNITDECDGKLVCSKHQCLISPTK